MDLEISLKITKSRNTQTSTDLLRITRDGSGPLLVSRETETMFVLTAHLSGFRKERIMIEISEDGTRISISGDKPVKETVMVRWRIYKNVEIMGFKKVFVIPDGVLLNKIKAKFNDNEDGDAVLSIFMPKLKKGIQGIEIKEVKEQEIQTPPPPLELPRIHECEDDTGEGQESILHQAEPSPHQHPNVGTESLQDWQSTTVPEPLEEAPDEEEIQRPPPPGLPKIHESEDTITGGKGQDSALHQLEPSPHQNLNVGTENLEDWQSTTQSDPLGKEDEQIEDQEIQKTKTKELPEIHEPEDTISSKEQKQVLQGTKFKEVNDPKRQPPPKFPEIHESDDTITGKAQESVLHQQEPSPHQHSRTEMLEVGRPATEPKPLKEAPDVEDELTGNRVIQGTKIEEVNDQEEIQKEETEIPENKEKIIVRVQLPEDEERIKEREEELRGSIHEEEEEKEGGMGEQTPSPSPPPQRYRLCAPCLLVGSTCIGFLVVIVIQLIGKHKKSKKV